MNAQQTVIAKLETLPRFKVAEVLDNRDSLCVKFEAGFSSMDKSKRRQFVIICSNTSKEITCYRA